MTCGGGSWQASRLSLSLCSLSLPSLVLASDVSLSWISLSPGSPLLPHFIEIARVMRSRSIAKNLAGSVKEILGTCVSVGCTIDGKDPKDLQEEISNGDVEIPSDHDPNPPPPPSWPSPPAAPSAATSRWTTPSACSPGAATPASTTSSSASMACRCSPSLPAPTACSTSTTPTGGSPSTIRPCPTATPSPAPPAAGATASSWSHGGPPYSSPSRRRYGRGRLPWEAFQLRLGWLVEYQHRPRLVPVNSSWGIYLCSPEASPPLSTLSQFPFVIGFSCVTASNSM